MENKKNADGKVLVSMRETILFEKICKENIPVTLGKPYEIDNKVNDISMSGNSIPTHRINMFSDYCRDYKRYKNAGLVYLLLSILFVFCFLVFTVGAGVTALKIMHYSYFVSSMQSEYGNSSVSKLEALAMYPEPEDDDFILIRSGIVHILGIVTAFLAKYRSKKVSYNFDIKWYPYRQDLKFPVIKGKYTIDLNKKI